MGIVSQLFDHIVQQYPLHPKLYIFVHLRHKNVRGKSLCFRQLRHDVNPFSRGDVFHAVDAIVSHIAGVPHDHFQIKPLCGVDHLTWNQVSLFGIVFDDPIGIILAVLEIDLPLFGNDLVHTLQIIQQIQ